MNEILLNQDSLTKDDNEYHPLIVEDYLSEIEEIETDIAKENKTKFIVCITIYTIFVFSLGYIVGLKT